MHTHTHKYVPPHTYVYVPVRLLCWRTRAQTLRPPRRPLHYPAPVCVYVCVCVGNVCVGNVCVCVMCVYVSACVRWQCVHVRDHACMQTFAHVCYIYVCVTMQARISSFTRG